MSADARLIQTCKKGRMSMKYLIIGLLLSFVVSCGEPIHTNPTPLAHPECMIACEDSIMWWTDVCPEMGDGRCGLSECVDFTINVELTADECWAIHQWLDRQSELANPSCDWHWPCVESGKNPLRC